MSVRVHHFYDFGPFRLDSVERILLRHNQIVCLRPKCFDILLMLVENSGHIVEKDELMHTIWPDSYVEEGNLTFNISLLRKVLSENSENSKYIETVPRRGYRFIAEVKKVEEPSASHLSHAEPIGNTTIVEEEAESHLLKARSTANNPPALSTAPGQHSRPAIFSFIALMIVLAATLVSIKTWRKAKESVAVNAEAYQLYLKGRSEWNKRNRDAVERAIDFFEQALGRDPNYAAAYAGLADCYILLGSAVRPAPAPAVGLMPKAKYAAERAIVLDDGLAEAHASLAFVRLWYEWDFAGAKREFTRAIELDPKYATAHQWYAHYLTAIGHHEEAIREARLAHELDPSSPNKTSILGFQLYFARQYNQAIEQAQEAHALDNRLRPMYCANAYVELHRYSEAVEYYLQANANAGEIPEKLDELKRAFRTGGIRGFWKKQIEQLTEIPRQDGELSRYFATIYALLGEKDKAFIYLEKMVEERNGFLIYLKVDPPFDSLRSDPRYVDLVRRIGFPQE